MRIVKLDAETQKLVDEYNAAHPEERDAADSATVVVLCIIGAAVVISALYLIWLLGNPPHP